MLGPHFYFDLIRLARKPRNHVLRCGYLLVLLVAWWFVYESSIPTKNIPLNNINNIHALLASNFANTLLCLQYALIVVVTPVYLAGAFMEEKQNRTLELLFQTELTDREILLGKFAARVVHLMLLVLSVLPLLAIISLWGGIILESLALHFALSLLLILLIGSSGLLASVSTFRIADALVMIFAWEFVFGYFFFFVSIILLSGPIHPAWTLLIVTLIVLAVSVLFCYCALGQLGLLRRTGLKRFGPLASPQPRTPAVGVSRGKPRMRPSIVIADRALYWKETAWNRLPLEVTAKLLIIPLTYECLLGFGSLIARCFFPLDPIDRGLIACFPMQLFMIYLGLVGSLFLSHSLSATSCVALEREQETLEPLLLLPVERFEILFIKWIGPWLRNRIMVMVVLAFPLVGTLLGVFSIRAGLALLVLPWPSLFFVNFLGLFLSVVCRRVFIANVILVCGVVLILFLHLLRWRDFGDLMQGYFYLILDTENPRPPTWNYTLWLVGLQQGLFLLLAMLFAGLAFWRFSRRTDDHS